MEETKSIFSSVTFWSLLLSVLGKALYFAGYDIGDTNGIAEIIVSLIGDIGVLWGRLRATTKVTVTGK
jgi:hypothetical protein